MALELNSRAASADALTFHVPGRSERQKMATVVGISLRFHGIIELVVSLPLEAATSAERLSPAGDPGSQCINRQPRQSASDGREMRGHAEA